MRRRVTRRLTRLQTMYNVLKHRKTYEIRQKSQFTATATEPHRNRKFRQFDKDQHCTCIPMAEMALRVEGLQCMTTHVSLSKGPTIHFILGCQTLLGDNVSITSYFLLKLTWYIFICQRRMLEYEGWLDITFFVYSYLYPCFCGYFYKSESPEERIVKVVPTIRVIEV